MGPTSALATWLTFREAAAYLRVSRSTLERLRRRGIGPQGYRVGRRRLPFSETELAEWLRLDHPEEPPAGGGTGSDRS